MNHDYYELNLGAPVGPFMGKVCFIENFKLFIVSYNVIAYLTFFLYSLLLSNPPSSHAKATAKQKALFSVILSDSSEYSTSIQQLCNSVSFQDEPFTTIVFVSMLHPWPRT